MELENLVMTELKNMDLSGVKVINLSCRDEATDVSFEIGDVKIDFTAENESAFQVTALTHAGQTYTDEETLTKGTDWAKYIWTAVYPIIKKHQIEVAEMATKSDINVFNVSEVDDNEPKVENPEDGDELKTDETGSDKLEINEADVEELPINDDAEKPNSEEADGSKLNAEETDVEEFKVNEPSVDNSKVEENDDTFKIEEATETVVVSLGENTLNKRIEEAEARGHKEGYKAARKKNVQELRKLKKKYNLILFFTIVILLSAFIAFLHAFGFDFSILVQF